MPKITFLPDNQVCEAVEGTSIQEAAEKAGVSIAFPCAGKGVCGKCLIKVQKGAVTFEDNGKLSQELQREGFVLACKSKVAAQDAEILVVSSLSEEQGKFSDALSRIGIDEALYPTSDEIQPFTQCIEVLVEQPEMLDGLGDYDRFVAAVKNKLSQAVVQVPLEVLSKLPNALRERDGQIYVWYATIQNSIVIVDVDADASPVEYGLAIDIGTTTVAIELVDLYHTKVIDTITNYNEQIERGEDVISRISYAKNPQRIQEMQQRVVATINKGIDTLCARNQGLHYNCIRNITIAANTTMVQMFMGINPNYIRLEPYTPAVMQIPLYTAASYGLHACPNAYVWMAPNVGSYVGGDITAGILCTDFASGTEEVCLFIDIGTNGEIVLGNNDFLLSCACSAGPAFEGGGIEKGMRASKGAIERVEIDPETGVASYSVIGGGAAKGICGSGLISLVAEMFDKGIVDQRGKMNQSGKYAAISLQGKNARYYLVPPQGNETGVYLTENDIDNFIRAKAAIFSACVTMLNSVELDFDCVTKFYIAGGFGRYINIERSQMLGLLPMLPEENFLYIGNSSLAGSFMALVSQKHREKIAELANRITYIDLSTEPKYMDEYVAAMFLPHTDARLFQRSN